VIKDEFVALVLVATVATLAALTRGGLWLLEAVLLGSLAIYIMVETVKKMSHESASSNSESKVPVQSRVMHYAILTSRLGSRRSSVLAKSAFEKALVDKLGGPTDLDALLDELVKTVGIDEH
jgi:hypothetical protein